MAGPVYVCVSFRWNVQSRVQRDICFKGGKSGKSEGKSLIMVEYNYRLERRGVTM